MFPVDWSRCSMLRKALPWSLFAMCLALFALGSTPLAHTVDLVLIALKIIILILVSVLVVRGALAGRSTPHLGSDRGESIRQSFTRWCRGEHRLG